MMPLENEPRSDKIFVDHKALCELFEHAKLRALKTALKLEVLIAELKLDKGPDEMEVTKDSQPMPNLLMGLSLDLLIVEYLKLVLRITRSIRKNNN